MSRIRVLGFALLSALALAPQVSPLAAQETYPNRAIHIIVPFPAGGPSDVLARMIGQKMSADFGQPVIIENRVGANTIIGAQVVVKAPPDGYTLLAAIDSTLVMNQFLYKNLPYDPFNDFAPITLIAKTMGLLMVNSASEVKTVKDLIAKAKAEPGKLNFGAGTITTKLTGYIFNDVAGIDTVLVPYNGSAEVANGILTKAVDFVFDGTSAELPLIEAGRLRALAKLDPRPFPPVPDLPTLEDATGLKFGDLGVLAGPGRAQRHAARDPRQAGARNRKSTQRPRHQIEGRCRGPVSRDQHARGIRGLHPERSRALATRREKERHAL